MEVVAKLSVLLFVLSGVLFSLVRGLRSREKSLIDPVFILGAFIIVYLFIADYLYWSPREYKWIGRDFSSVYINAYYSSFLAFFSFFVSYYFFLGRVAPFRGPRRLDYDSLNTQKVFIFGLLSVAMPIFSILLTGGEIGSNDGVFGVEFSNNSLISYSLSIISFCILSVLVLIYNGKKKKAVFLIFSYVFVSYMLGFRFRIAILFVALLIFYVNYGQIRLKRIVNLGLMSLLGLLIISYLGSVRVAGKGVDVEKLSEFSSVFSSLDGVLNDSNVFLTTALSLESRGETVSFRGFQEIFYIFIHPVPRSIWSSKPYFKSDAVELIGTYEAFTAGAAYSLMGSFYNMYGFPTLVISFFLLGVIFAKLGYRHVRSNGSALHYSLLCAVTYAWFFYANTRGYLPQIIQDLVFILLPFWIFRLSYFRSIK